MIELPGDVGAKIEWAELKLQELDERVREYAATSPIELQARVEDGVIEGRRSWAIWAEVRTPPPVQLSLLAGDVVQNTRGALDYLARALVRTVGGQPVDGPGGTQFPILVKPPKKALGIAGCADADILRRVAAVQPYATNRPDQHPLARLNEFNNTIKHQAIPVLTGAGGVPAVVAIYDEGGSPTGTVAGFARWFFDGDRLDPVRGLFAPHVVPLAEGDFETVVAISADAWFTVGMVDELDFYLRYVRDYVIPEFRPYFSEPWPEDMFASDPPTSPYSSLPKPDPARFDDMLDRMLQRVVSRIGKPKPGLSAWEQPLIVMGLLEGVSEAKGYSQGGTPLAGPLAPEFGGPSRSATDSA